MKKFKFKIEGVSYSVNVQSVEGNEAQIEVNGKNYTVELEEVWEGRQALFRELCYMCLSARLFPGRS